MREYLNLLQHILENGEKRADRTGTGTLSVFGHQSRYDLRAGFPLVTTKKLHVKSIFHELLWFLSGNTNISYLKENGVSIWDEWANEQGDLGPVYGYQWRRFGERTVDVETAEGLVVKAKIDGVDQISQLVNDIKNNPQSRRLIVSAWNPVDVPNMALPPCHSLFQFYVSSDGGLSCQLYQRSADVFLGVPFNIASYALLVHMVAHVCKLTPKEFVHTIGDAHLYLNHIEQAQMQIARDPRPLPLLQIGRQVESIFDFKYEDFTIEGYNPHPSIKAPIAV